MSIGTTFSHIKGKLCRISFLALLLCLQSKTSPPPFSTPPTPPR
uniref:Uncharacterized protein n=1 Tax=Anguilla anguilla TaxID=7936 RepID=A0A0E9R3L1_ANGAN